MGAEVHHHVHVGVEKGKFMAQLAPLLVGAQLAGRQGQAPPLLLLLIDVLIADALVCCPKVAYTVSTCLSINLAPSSPFLILSFSRGIGLTLRGITGHCGALSAASPQPAPAGGTCARRELAVAWWAASGPANQASCTGGGAGGRAATGAGGGAAPLGCGSLLQAFQSLNVSASVMVEPRNCAHLKSAARA